MDCSKAPRPVKHDRKKGAVGIKLVGTGLSVVIDFSSLIISVLRLPPVSEGWRFYKQTHTHTHTHTHEYRLI